MNPGKLRHRITFQKLSETKNDYGEEIKDWVDIQTVSASINPISAREFFAAEKMNSEVSHKIYMRYLPQVDIKSNMRIKFGTRIFEITGPPINFEEKNHQILLMCKEVF